MLDQKLVFSPPIDPDQFLEEGTCAYATALARQLQPSGGTGCGLFRHIFVHFKIKVIEQLMYKCLMYKVAIFTLSMFIKTKITSSLSIIKTTLKYKCIHEIAEM